MARSGTVPLVLAFAAGVALWLVAASLTEKREPWDASAYWAIVYPAAIAGCALLGYRYPERSWRWALVLFEAQFLAMCARNGELGSLWPLGMGLFAVIAVPGIVAARLASRIGGGPTKGTASAR